MIRQFSCHNFRNINIDNLELSKINILIGPNNSGKTNFIKALTFYSNMLKHANEGQEETDFLNAISRNGWKHIKNYNSDQKEAVDFEWKLDLDNEPYVYKFAFKTGDNRNDFFITQEELNAGKVSPKYKEPYNYFSAHLDDLETGMFSSSLNKGKENKRLFFKVKSNETICSQFKDILLEDKAVYDSNVVRNHIAKLIGELEASFKSIYLYSAASINTPQIRKASDMNIQGQFLRSDASNFVNVFADYKNRSLNWKIEYINNMKQLIRDLKDVDVINFRDELVLRMVEGGLDAELDLSDVSEGTLKALVWDLLCVTPNDQKYELLAIDEPECNLHPAWQKVVADWIQESKAYKQCIISTHSPDFLDKFTERYKTGNDISVLVFGHNGYISKISYNDIAESMGDWLLGDLYRTQDQALGGWPW